MVVGALDRAQSASECVRSILCGTVGCDPLRLRASKFRFIAINAGNAELSVRLSFRDPRESLGILGAPETA